MPAFESYRERRSSVSSRIVYNYPFVCQWMRYIGRAIRISPQVILSRRTSEPSSDIELLSCMDSTPTNFAWWTTVATSKFSVSLESHPNSGWWRDIMLWASPERKLGLNSGWVDVLKFSLPRENLNEVSIPFKMFWVVDNLDLINSSRFGQSNAETFHVISNHFQTAKQPLWSQFE
jgi:hypothetical protein